MKFYPLPCNIPGGKSFGATPQMLADLKSINLIPRQIGAWANEEHWIESMREGTPWNSPDELPDPKYWVDNSVSWRPEPEFRYVLLTGLPVHLEVNGSGFSDPTFEVLHLTAARFYDSRLRAQDPAFRRIPQIHPFLISRDVASKCKLRGVKAPGTSYPLGMVESGMSTFRSDMALRFHPETGQPEAFFVEEYVREFPYTAIRPPSTQPPARAITPQEAEDVVEHIRSMHPEGQRGNKYIAFFKGAR